MFPCENWSKAYLSLSKITKLLAAGCPRHLGLSKMTGKICQQCQHRTPLRFMSQERMEIRGTNYMGQTGFCTILRFPAVLHLPDAVISTTTENSANIIENQQKAANVAPSVPFISSFSLPSDMIPSSQTLFPNEFPDYFFRSCNPIPDRKQNLKIFVQVM